MENVKEVKLKLVVEVTIECTDPSSFTSQRQFEYNDVKEMKPYLSQRIAETLDGAWQFAARVTKIKIH